MKAARYKRSWRRNRNVKMSDCQSWFGAARSKRRGGCSRAPGASSVSGMSPSSCRIRRTSVSLTPRASKRAKTSRMRRVTCSGCSIRSATTASRLTSGVPLAPTRRRRGVPETSPSTPLALWAANHMPIVDVLGPNHSDAWSTVTRPLRTSSTTRMRNAIGYPRPPACSAVADHGGLPPPLCCPRCRLIPSLLSCCGVDRGEGEGARRSEMRSGAHQLARGTRILLGWDTPP